MNPGTARDDDDELIRLYHAAADREGGEPAPAVGEAVRAHARVMAASRQRSDTPDTAVAPAAGQDTASNAVRWRLSMLGGLAVIGLAGLLVLQFDRGTPQEQDLVRAPDVAAPQRGEAAMSAPAPQAESVSQDATASAKASDTQPAAAPAAAPTEAARADADARSAKAPASMRDRSVALAPPPAAARAHADAESATPAMTAPPAADAAGASLAAPPSNRLAPQARPGAAAADAHGLAAAGDWPAFASRLAAGTPVDIRDSQGRTPLMHAAAAGQLDMVRRLLDAGADARLVDTGGRTAGDWARRAERPDIASMLDDAQRNPGAGR